MKTDGNREEKLRMLLKCAYDEKEKVDVGESWKWNVMNRVRREASLAPDERYLYTLERLVWRLAPATLTLSVVLSTLLVRVYLSSAHNALQYFMNCAQELTLARILGV